MNKVVVVIPVYKENLSESEKASLSQVRSVLYKYDICFIAPQKMKSFFTEKNIQAEYWLDENFADVSAYSHLLLTEEFYRRFSAYEYMLVYQLDAFVFSDMLEEFCDMGYDYIGAPMPVLSSWRKMNTRVGNGGFSLRKISSCIRVILQKKEIYACTGREEEFERAEDKFFGYCGCDDNIDFTVPKIKVALSFAVEYNVMKIYSKLSESKLPFGCHAWSKPWYLEIWKPFLEKRVLNWSDVEKEVKQLNTQSYKGFILDILMDYLLERLLRKGKIILYDDVLKEMLPNNQAYVLWGCGKIGGDVAELLNLLNRNIICYLDSNIAKNTIENIEVIRPSKETIFELRGKIIISVKKEKYVEEIVTTLKNFGLQDGCDFIRCTELFKIIIDSYYQRSVKKWGLHN